MRTQLVSIPTDTVPLEGAFHEPDNGKATGAVLMFHGNTMNFYNGREDVVAGVVATWLAQTLGLKQCD